MNQKGSVISFVGLVGMIVFFQTTQSILFYTSFVVAMTGLLVTFSTAKKLTKKDPE